MPFCFAILGLNCELYFLFRSSTSTSTSASTSGFRSAVSLVSSLPVIARVRNAVAFVRSAASRFNLRKTHQRSSDDQRAFSYRSARNCSIRDFPEDEDEGTEGEGAGFFAGDFVSEASRFRFVSSTDFDMELSGSCFSMRRRSRVSLNATMTKKTKIEQIFLPIGLRNFFRKRRLAVPSFHVPRHRS